MSTVLLVEHELLLVAVGEEVAREETEEETGPNDESRREEGEEEGDVLFSSPSCTLVVSAVDNRMKSAIVDTL